MNYFIQKAFKLLIYLLLVIDVLAFILCNVINIIMMVGLNFDIRIFRIMILAPFLFFFSLIMSIYYIGKDDGKKEYKYGIRDWPAVKHAPNWMIHFFQFVFVYLIAVMLIYSRRANDGRIFLSCILTIIFSIPIPVFTSYILKDKIKKSVSKI